MTVTAPPHRSDSEASARPDPGEALIEEARRRARRRHRMSAGIAIVVSIVAVTAIAVTLAAAGAGSSSDEPRSPDAGAGVPAFVAPAAKTELVASWGEIHDGWVLVYADGRVIWYPDSGAGLGEGASRYATFERRLTPEALQLVQSGAIHAKDFNRADLVPSLLWAEPAFRPYVPAEYAVCGWEQGELSGAWVDATSVLGDLPPAVRTLLRDTHRTFSGFSFLAMTPPEAQEPTTCFALTTEAADDLVYLSHRPTLRYQRDGDSLTFVDSEKALVTTMWMLPVMPHGQFVLWGG